MFEVLDPEKVEEAARSIVSDPWCSYNPFTRDFRTKFSSEADLKSAVAAMVLLVTALLMRMETVRVECRHAWVRRLRNMLSQSHWQSFHMASAQTRVLERGSCLSHASIEHNPGESCDDSDYESEDEGRVAGSGGVLVLCMTFVIFICATAVAAAAAAIYFSSCL